MAASFPLRSTRALVNRRRRNSPLQHSIRRRPIRHQHAQRTIPIGVLLQLVVLLLLRLLSRRPHRRRLHPDRNQLAHRLRNPHRLLHRLHLHLPHRPFLLHPQSPSGRIHQHGQGHLRRLQEAPDPGPDPYPTRIRIQPAQFELQFEAGSDREV
ncbi:hypothetical protein LINPERPRIM_LOCUS12413 [Linum perenne]